uniref:Conopeptide X11.1 n=1 Tax=Conasprella ximenes TaxID=257349 RepID=I1B1_CONXI|nr:RecName: Full=Conopeptide X11.1; AltName: Full=I1_xm11a; Flags: Precursor [Conasprella ximenes]
MMKLSVSFLLLLMLLPFITGEENSDSDVLKSGAAVRQGRGRCRGFREDCSQHRDCCGDLCCNGNTCVITVIACPKW